MVPRGVPKYELLGAVGPFGPRVGRVVVCKLVFTWILYILCQQLGGCISFGVYIGIVYIMPTILGICVSCWVSVGASGQGWGGVCQLVFTLVLYISCQQLGGYV